jgi:hypothetical protein
MVSGRKAALNTSRLSKPSSWTSRVSDFKTLALKFAHGVEHRFVFCFNRNEVLAAAFVKMRSALQGQVVGLGSTAGPDNFTGVCTDEIGHIDAGFFDSRFGFPAPSVAA